jgi:hypothetical protein
MKNRIKKYKIAPEDSSQWKCNWINCTHGLGLAGNGTCSARGEWFNSKCTKFEKEAVINLFKKLCK